MLAYKFLYTFSKQTTLQTRTKRDDKTPTIKMKKKNQKQKVSGSKKRRLNLYTARPSAIYTNQHFETLSQKKETT
jgi:hypothetical protein